MSDTLPRLTAALADRYTVKRKLGEGGMATVYLAQDLKHARSVAVKVLKPTLAQSVGSTALMPSRTRPCLLRSARNPSRIALHRANG